MWKIKQAMNRFMYGRYGADELSKAICILMIVLAIINLVLKSYTVYLLNSVLVIILVFRMFSKNSFNRQQENKKYLSLKGSITAKFKLIKMRIRDRKNCRYRKCPACKSIMKLPVKKGKHTVICRNCSYEFGVRI